LCLSDKIKQRFQVPCFKSYKLLNGVVNTPPKRIVIQGTIPNLTRGSWHHSKRPVLKRCFGLQVTSPDLEVQACYALDEKEPKNQGRPIACSQGHTAPRTARPARTLY